MFVCGFLVFCLIARVSCKPIVNGVEIDSDEILEYSYMSSLQHPKAIALRGGFKHFCGGARIHPNWILTAAHCLDGKNSDGVVVVIGEKVVDSQNDTRYNVTQIQSNGYNKYTLRNDIALIKVASDHLDVKMLPLYEGEIPYGQKCKIIGYGATEYTGKTPNPLSVAYVNLITNDECTDIMGRIMGPRMENVCALSKGAMDTCQGDSGGPLICEKDGKEFVVGITSRGSGCGIPGVPSLYTLVEPFKGWINETVQRL
ncbi:unnamed protein product [Hermetia illucens]|uniref:trypsin n=1 Tax=Hermetia illucens TaxID=343691 RepID=A0A7R8UNT0_HERIL|nr:chymotrypsin A [Hermetia illucens]CAD7084050.1 unnamed protein product [Hermetia illucens]